MILEYMDIKINEYRLAEIINFSPRKGVSPNMMKTICENYNVEYSFHFGSTIEELQRYINKGFYPIVLVKPSVLYNLPESEHGHYIIVKDITNKNIVINDPDQEFGGENKEVDLETFTRAWNSKFRLIFILGSEIK